MKKMFLGLDIGSASTDLVVIDDEPAILVRQVAETHPDHRIAARNILESALACLAARENRACERKDILFCTGTGYGRGNIPFADSVITEVAAHVRGALHYFPEARTVIDIGGQDSKVIALDADGEVADFAMNEKCAAGTGRFLEKMSEIMEVGLDEIGPLSLQTSREVQVSSTCVVFAESEVISRLAAGEPKDAILRGVHAAVMSRVLGLARRIGLKPPVVFCGGAARNVGMVEALIRQTGLARSQVLVAPDPQITGALGAALAARDQFGRIRSGRA